MKAKTLNSIIRLFAIMSNFKPGKGNSIISNIIEMYLSTHFSKQATETSLEALARFQHDYDNQRRNNPNNWETFFDSEIDANCYILSRELETAQRLLVLIYLIDVLPYLLNEVLNDIKPSASSQTFKILSKISQDLHLNNQDFLDCLAFVKESYQDISSKNSIYIITDNANLQIPEAKINHINNIEGQVIFLRLVDADTILFRVSGEASFEMNGNQIFKRRTYILKRGTSLLVNGINTIYYNDIEKDINKDKLQHHLYLEIKDLEYHFKKGDWGIKPMFLEAESGEMLAIMGGSGSGKTTLMRLMTGLIKPQKGTIKLNGIDVYANPEHVRPHIGYVPQEDALNEELTAFDNLFYTASLCLGELNKKAIANKVEALLKELELWDIKDLKVGNPLKKIISGGQRKRLNIALELVREPGVLFLDEPTSGLSSSDSEVVMNILKNLTHKGQLVVINIHQPSSYVFQLFDKLLLLDKGGRAIYFGPAMRINSFLKRTHQLIDANQSECQTCGNLNPDDIFHLVQKPKIDANGKYRDQRLISPERWHRHYIRIYHATLNETKPTYPELQKTKLATPSLIKQLAINVLRNSKTKLADQLTVIISLLLPPILGIILSFFSKNISPKTNVYLYAENQNIPAFVFMSVIVAIFIGLMSSSQEIIKERRILQREAFLSLNYPSYIFSKILYLSLLSFVQIFSFLWVSEQILNIPADGGWFFLLLWVTAICSNAMGLFLSSVFKSQAAVYITIPLIIIPQILLAGAVIKYERMHPSLTSHGKVPLASQLMLSRWAYEGIATSLFLNNEHSQKFYNIDQQIQDATYLQSIMLPEMESIFFEERHTTNLTLTKDSSHYLLIENGLEQLGAYGYPPTFHKNGAAIDGETFQNFLDSVKNEVNSMNAFLNTKKDSLINTMMPDDYTNLRRHNFNKKLAEHLTYNDNYENIKVENDQFIRKFNPIYDLGQSNGTHHFFSPQKEMLGLTLSTPKFNAIVIALQTLLWLLLTLIKRVERG
jgi:ABC-type multidrug transport system ATPase subunit